MTTEKKHRKHQPPQLRAVLDSSVLHNDSATDLVRHDVATLIKESTFPDLELQWYLPETVRHERQYRMRESALRLLPNIEKVERLLGHNLAINEETLLDGVEKIICQRHDELGLIKLALDYSQVDWNSVALDAAYRRPPFEAGDKEKGFRDRLIVECFLQLVAASPKTPGVCRVVLVSNDALMRQAALARTVGQTNVTCVSTLDELKGLINTLVSEVDETFLSRLKPKAAKLFFVPNDESTFFFKQNVRERLMSTFAKELAEPPPGATARTNGTWRISPPNFVKKERNRVQWTSRVEVEAEATGMFTQWASIGTASLPLDPVVNVFSTDNYFKPNANRLVSAGQDFGTYNTVPLGTLAKPLVFADVGNYVSAFKSSPSVPKYKGVDVYEVLWSADVDSRHELRRPSVDDIKRLEPTWEQVT
jgi:hypothetical protein